MATAQHSILDQPASLYFPIPHTEPGGIPARLPMDPTTESEKYASEQYPLDDEADTADYG
jgi:hypothetical protein